MTEANPVLDFELTLPETPRDGARIVVLLHGRGADETDLRGVAPALPRGSVLVTPRAPFPGGPWGYGPGWAWYRYVAEDRVVPETLDESLEKLGAFLTALPDRLPVEPGPLALGGFSQGGTTSLAYALGESPVRPADVLVFSGFLPRSLRATVSPDTVAGARFFWGHGLRDPAIPHALARKGRELLTEAGADLLARDYAMGHGIAPEELSDAVARLESSADLPEPGEDGRPGSEGHS